MAVGEKVVLGFSGGVDSLVAARLIRERGCEVLLLFLEMGDRKDGFLRSRAQAGADQLGLELVVENVSRSFRREVVDYLKNSYLAGETPNPCLVCNARIKFAGLKAVADRLGWRTIATGHYCCLAADPARAGRKQLLKGCDRVKDQSYFLCLVPRDILDRTVFPLGDMEKNEVLARARKLSGSNLENYRESQELCFLHGENYRDFLAREGLARRGPGAIVNLQGEVLGCHSGLENYTVGQRRGLDVAWSEPLYVLRLEVGNNRLVVGPRAAAGCRRFTVAGVNWLIDEPLGPGGEMKVLCQIRYRHRPAPARLRPGSEKGLLEVEFVEPQFAVAPGQGAAFYAAERLLGGGFIRRTDLTQINKGS